MYSKSGWKKGPAPLAVVVPVVELPHQGHGCCPPAGMLPPDAVGAAWRDGAEQVRHPLQGGTVLQVVGDNFCFHSSSRVASHLARQTMLWSPEASGSLHEQPRQPATSFSPLRVAGEVDVGVDQREHVHQGAPGPGQPAPVLSPCFLIRLRNARS